MINKRGLGFRCLVKALAGCLVARVAKVLIWNRGFVPTFVNGLKNDQSSLHWPILFSFRVFFVQ